MEDSLISFHFLEVFIYYYMFETFKVHQTFTNCVKNLCNHLWLRQSEFLSVDKDQKSQIKHLIILLFSISSHFLTFFGNFSHF